jgi:hypothetical protein
MPRRGMGYQFSDGGVWWQDLLGAGVDILKGRYGVPPPGTVITGPGGQVIRQSPGYPTTPGTGTGYYPPGGGGSGSVYVPPVDYTPLLIGGALVLGLLFVMGQKK